MQKSACVGDSKSQQNVNGAPVRKVKPPVVRQTLTSKYRLLKANPLYAFELEKTIIDSERPKKVPLRSLAGAIGQSLPFLSTTISENNELKIETIKSKPRTYNTIKSLPAKAATKKIEPKIVPKKVLPKPMVFNKNPQKLGTNTRKRSLSMQNLTIAKTRPADKKPTLLNTPAKVSSLINLTMTPISKPATFKTPIAYRQRQKTPRSVSVSVCKTTSGPAMSDITRRLQEWLKRRGKDVEAVNHLKCFDRRNLNLKPKMQPLDEGNKENITNIQELPTFIESNGENNCKMEQTARAALTDLHYLIQEGYPVEQCDLWLKLIQTQYRKLEEEPQYWECRAAIEEARGDFTSAVDCYKTAIVQGSEIDAVDQSLDQLLQKFDFLNLGKDANKLNNTNCRIKQEPKNIFKSTIIQFAVQEKKLKTKHDENNKTKQFVATPVRRSSRVSRGAFTSTPGVQVFSTLRDVDTDLQKSMIFQTNKSLVN